MPLGMSPVKHNWPGCMDGKYALPLSPINHKPVIGISQLMFMEMYNYLSSPSAFNCTVMYFELAFTFSD